MSVLIEYDMSEGMHCFALYLKGKTGEIPARTRHCK
ncbi:hypothetical protein JOC74_001774 [Bacillus capparidis]|uniref:Uncharacterized protein n=1 Tax=Bacillus capparidis TaxID=1840411 RepID=A0ABS4CVY0_9BACI|nr:hypothetical protein [Bacillus capparidis]